MTTVVTQPKAKYNTQATTAVKLKGRLIYLSIPTPIFSGKIENIFKSDERCENIATGASVTISLTLK